MSSVHKNYSSLIAVSRTTRASCTNTTTFIRRVINTNVKIMQICGNFSVLTFVPNSIVTVLLLHLLDEPNCFSLVCLHSLNESILALNSSIHGFKSDRRRVVWRRLVDISLPLVEFFFICIHRFIRMFLLVILMVVFNKSPTLNITDVDSFRTRKDDIRNRNFVDDQSISAIMAGCNQVGIAAVSEIE